MGKKLAILFCILAGSLFLSACQSGKLDSNPPTDTPAATLTPFQPTATPTPVTIWFSAAVPDLLQQVVASSGLEQVTTPEAATARLDILKPQSSTNEYQSSAPRESMSVWIYVLVAPFPTVTDGVLLADIQHGWAGLPSGAFAGRPLLMDQATQNAFTALWGNPAPGAVHVASADQLIDLAWSERPAWAIIPFEKLEPRWKVLSVDGQSPVHNDFNPDNYPLKISFSLSPKIMDLPASNRDPQKLTVLAMTGTTALVRATADRMEKNGVLYPGGRIDSMLRSADITHISNEVAFDAACPTPDPWTKSLFFCSNPDDIALLEDAGTDVVELTGNHLLDYGPDNFLKTLDMYVQRGWRYYGGGRDVQDAQKPALIENHGNKLAFVGCDFPGPSTDWATATSPGAAPCDFSSLAREIAGLRSQGYLPIMSFQYQEYYQPNPTYEEKVDFRRMAEAGAVIVSGSQAHEPAAMEIMNGSFIHYGLGNLFFDQMFSLPTRELFVDRHVFYNGKYINTELLTYIIEDYAQPRPMTVLERKQFLQKIFQVAGW
ncbi:MAG TPA: CapA family protein [Anaerolineales bacterium]|nr:CapA family protein [Anaerolineales bacterium]